MILSSCQKLDSIKKNFYTALISCMSWKQVFYALVVTGYFYYVHAVYAVSSLTITEIMKDPVAVSDTAGEWFEVYNNDSQPFNIATLVIRDNDADTHKIDASVTTQIPTHSYFVFCRNGNSDDNGGISCGYVYSSISLGNNDDEIILEKDGNEIDRVVYTDKSFPDVSGSSMELTDMGDDNNDGTNWHAAYTSYGDGDRGTPGSENKPVPTQTPTITPTPSNTPKPTTTPEPTAASTPTSVPTDIPKPTPTPKPTVKKVPTKGPDRPAVLSPTTKGPQPLRQLSSDQQSGSDQFQDSSREGYKQDEEQLVKNALKGVEGGIGDINTVGTYEGKDGAILATSSAHPSGSISPIPFLVVGGMALTGMVGSAIYIRRRKQSEIEL